MKLLLLPLYMLMPMMGICQLLIQPGNAAIEYKRIANEETRMNWYLLQDTTKIAIGTVFNRIITDSQYIMLVSTVQMRHDAGPRIDTTIADRNTLRPVYHASYNADRDMTIHYNDLITASYADKRQGNNISVTDTSTSSCFDSNLYPTLIRWLPLKTGFMKDLAIYDFNPGGRKGVMKASIIAVRQCDYEPEPDVLKKVWMVIVRDDMGAGTTTYFIDVQSRKLWKMIISVGDRKMLMEAA
ncbi:MAG: hypothetical protein EOO04_13595 [Chitinophagaceae bacterium]|nr:MAG: hypothetical protein EOO04_13595 [Chitinophagaceae bacterium]